MDVRTYYAEHVGSSLNCMLQSSIQSIVEVTRNWCHNVASRASWKWLEMDVTTSHPERLRSWLKWMLQRRIQSVFEVDWNGCYNVAYMERLGRCLKWLFQSVQNVFEFTRHGCYNKASRCIQNVLEVTGNGWDKQSNIQSVVAVIYWKWTSHRCMQDVIEAAWKGY